MPDEGTVEVDGQSVTSENLQQMRTKMAMVFQNFNLFSHLTVLDNITIAPVHVKGQEKGVAEEKARDLLKLVGLEEKAGAYPRNLSGGQKQRLSIARAIAKRPEVFIFDDSFSALDFKTDVALRKALKKRTKESTVLIVAQRISTILNAEQIIVLDDGKIAGIGTHKELLRNCEVYKQIAASQLSEKELQDGMQSEDRKTEDIKSETIKTEERKEAISAKTAEQEVRSDV